MDGGSDMPDESVWSPVQVSEYLGIPVKTIYKWVSEDRLPAYKIGRHIRFFPKEVRAFVEAQKIVGNR
jgi:excisionase family DNA binding protein